MLPVLVLAVGLIASASHSQSCSNEWIDRLSSQFSLSNRVRASTILDGHLCIGGDFAASLGVPAFLAKWVPGGVGGRGRWIGFDSGPNAGVTALAELGGRLYAAGNFSNVGGVPANRIAAWDPSAGGGTGAWSPLGSGVDGSIEAMLAVDGRLYVGGSFTTAGGMPANRIAVWDPDADSGNGAWASVGTGTNGIIWSLAAFEGGVVAGGQFTIAGGVTALRVAKFDLAGGVWAPLGVGFNDAVRALHVGSTGLHAGGSFTASGPTSTRRIAMWDPTANAGAGAWTRKGSIENGEVLTLAEVGGVLHAGGSFDQAGSTVVRKLAAWNPDVGVTGAWVSLGGGAFDTVETLTSLDDELHVGGWFTAVNTGSSWLQSRYLATWTPSGAAGIGAWRSADRSAGFNNSVFTTAVLEGDLYVGGEFTSIGGFAASRIARWRPDAEDGRGAWESVGGGMNQSVFRLVPHDGKLYAVGRFTQAGSVPCNHIACWDPNAADGVGAWAPLGSGLSDYGLDAAWFDGDLFVGGAFSIAGGVAASRIARWDPDSAMWLDVDGGFDDDCVRLLEIDDALWAVGYFTTAGGNPARRVARWTTDGSGSGAWSEVAGGTNGNVAAIGIHEGRVNIGGLFTEAGGSPAHSIAVLDPDANGGAGEWQPLGLGISVDGVHGISAFESWQGRLIVGGEFDAAGGVAADNLAAWDAATSTWSALGGGLDNVVHDLMLYQDRLLVTGKFVGAGSTAAYRIAEWGCEGTAPVSLAIAIEPSSSATSGSPLLQQPQVRLLDSAGDPVAVSGVEVLASIASGGGTLLGATVATTDASGMAVFSDLAISGAAGDRTLSFLAAVLPHEAVSTTITVADPCPSASLAFTRIRVPATALCTAVKISMNAACGWSASTAADWVSLTPTSGSGDGVLTIDTAHNPGPNTRSATISISTSAGESTLELVQTGIGRVVAWGISKYGLDGPPPGMETALFSWASSNRRLHGAIRSDGTVSVWGLDSDGQIAVPTSLLDSSSANVVDLCVGSRHIVAARSDGTVVAWGREVDGQCDVPTGLVASRVAAGRAHSIALRVDGTVAAWGRNQVGQCDVPADLADVIAIAAGDWHNLALRSDGTVAAWGDDTWGQATVPAGLDSVEAIAAGRNHSLALRSDGTIVAWGDDRAGQSTVRSDLSDPATAQVVAVAGARFASFALREDGSIVAMGTPPSDSGVVPPSAAGAVAIAAGDDATIAIVPSTPSTPPDAPLSPATDGVILQKPRSRSKMTRVPEDFESISQAIDAVGEGGTVVVGPGVRVEAIEVRHGGVLLTSSEGAARTTILGRRDRSVIVVRPMLDPTSVAAIRIEGFTISGGQAASGAGGGLRIEGGLVVVDACTFVDNLATIGGGIALLDGEVLLRDCDIVGNLATSRAGALAVFAGHARLQNSRFEGNEAPEHPSIWLAREGVLDVEAQQMPESLAFEIARLIENWGPCLDGRSRAMDLDRNGVVDGLELAELIANWVNDSEDPR